MSHPSDFGARPRLILFPGLGADQRMFVLQRDALPRVETPAWIPHEPGESMREYASRFARTLDVREPVMLGGVSFGGMLALEIARIVPTRGVVLIGSTRDMRAVNPLLRLSERCLRLAPEMLVDRGRILAPIFVGRGGSLAARHRDLLVTMARELPVRFLRWAARATIEWSGCADLAVPVHHIHGDRDIVFPLSRLERQPDVVVPGGIHVLNLSHPAEVNAFLAEHSGQALRLE